MQPHFTVILKSLEQPPEHCSSTYSVIKRNRIHNKNVWGIVRRKQITLAECIGMMLQIKMIERAHFFPG
jgi:hypothetical protein